MGGASGIFKLISDVLQRLHEKKLVDDAKQQGKSELEAKIAIEENIISKKQMDVLMQERTEEELKKKLEDGNF